jgi:hypothetical protein
MDGRSQDDGVVSGIVNGTTDGVGGEPVDLSAPAADVGPVHRTVDLTRVAKRIRRLHDHVCGRGQRVEVTRAGCDDVCVMISKRELEAMEAALAFYAGHPAHADLCRGLATLLAEAGMVHTPRAYGDGEAVRTFDDDRAAASS